MRDRPSCPCQYGNGRELDDPPHAVQRRETPGADLVVDRHAIDRTRDDQNQFGMRLAAARHDGEGRPGLVLGGGIVQSQDAFHRGKADHLAPELDEALEATLEGEHPVGILCHPIAGAVPALAVVLDEGRGALVAEVARGDARAANQQHAPLTARDASTRIGVDDGRLDTGQRLADGEWTRVVLVVDRDDRRAFSDD